MNNGLELMQTRLNHNGGASQQDRMIKEKRRTLDRVVLYSYQGASVQSIYSENEYRALINPNQVKQDYDDKIISIGFEADFVPGTVFEWKNTNTKWLIYLQETTELAYFKGDIRKCNYFIAWEDDNGEKHTAYAATRGPVETKIDSASKEGISLDSPNYTLNLLMPKDDDTLDYFKRYSKFYLKPYIGDPVCWRIEAIDNISMEGILQITATEYYKNETEDDIQSGVVGGLVIEEIPQPQSSEIIGDTFIKAKLPYTFKYIGDQESDWVIVNETSLPIDAIRRNKEIEITWKKSYTGEFVLQYGTEQKTVVVESLF